MDGAAAVTIAARGGESRLAHLYQRAPLRVMFPTPTYGEPLTAAIVTTSGGLVGGDRLSIDVGAEADATLLATSQAAEKIYRSLGPDCRIDVRLEAGCGAWLEWLPQETILFDGARLRRLTVMDLEPGSRVLAGEMLVFGRVARGERLTALSLLDAWEVRRSGRLVWADALRIEGNVATVLGDPACLSGARACATLVFAGSTAAELLAEARTLLAASEVRSGATVVAGVLVVRWLAEDVLALRDAFGAFWAAFRRRAGDLPPMLPRLWSI